MSAHDNDHVDNNGNMTSINRHIAASKSLLDFAAAASALIATTFGIYELSVINISTAATASPSPPPPPNRTNLKWASSFGTHLLDDSPFLLITDSPLVVAVVATATTPTAALQCRYFLNDM
jgi:hypothetical protein